MSGVDMSRTDRQSLTLDPAKGLKSKAEEQGYLTIDDVLEAYPEAEKQLPQLEHLLACLYDEGIEITTKPGNEETSQAQTDE